MTKKGELTLEYIILLILGLLVLILVAIMFQEQIGNFFSTISGTSSSLSKGAESAAEGLAIQ